MSTENVVAESWEDADADPVKEIMDKMEKVKLLQRKEEKKEAFFEKVKAEENGITPKLQIDEGGAQIAEEPKRVFLRRPKDGFTSETVAETSATPAVEHQSNPNPRGRSHHKSNHKEPKQTQTLEERQAAYQAARDRILGSEYKPDNQEIKEIKFIDRSKSPETLRMTEQNMVEHYGEELSRELMHQPVEQDPVPPQEMQFVPDFSFQQPPPSCIPHDGAEVYNGPPGFQHHQQNFQAPFQNQTTYYPQMNGHMQMAYPNQQAFQQFMQQENPIMSSSSQNSVMDGQNEQQHTTYYNYPSQPQQMHQNYAPFNLPNMAFPPPNFTSQGQQSNQQQNNPQMMSHMNQMITSQQMTQNQMMMPQYQMQNIPNRGPQNAGSGRGSFVPNNGIGRGQNRSPMMYMPGAPINQPPPQLMQQPINGQSYGGRNGGNGQQQQRKFQPNQQNGQFYPNQNVVQNNQNNVRKQNNARNGIQNDENPMQNMPMNVPSGQNPIPFGCPPRHVNAIREQYAMSSNSGAGLLGPHPLMSSTPWTAPPSQTRPQ